MSRSQFSIVGSQGRNAKQKTEAIPLLEGSVIPRFVLGWFSYTALDYLLRDGATHSELLPHASISNQNMPADQSDLSNSSVKVSLHRTVGCVELTKLRITWLGQVEWCWHGVYQL